jgi:hypothetical protein
MSNQPARKVAGTKHEISTVYASGKMKMSAFFLPVELREALKRAGRVARISQAQIVREALEARFAAAK